MGALDGFMYSCVSYVDGKICKSTCFPPTASQYTGTALQHHVLSSGQEYDRHGKHRSMTYISSKYGFNVAN